MKTETLIAGVEHAIQQVSMSTTLFFTGLLVLMIICLALEEKIHAKKSLIVGTFAAMPFWQVASCIFYLLVM